jgi:hypothetical protein
MVGDMRGVGIGTGSIKSELWERQNKPHVQTRYSRVLFTSGIIRMPASEKIIEQAGESFSL